MLLRQTGGSLEHLPCLPRPLPRARSSPIRSTMSNHGPLAPHSARPGPVQMVPDRHALWPRYGFGGTRRSQVSCHNSHLSLCPGLDDEETLGPRSACPPGTANMVTQSAVVHIAHPFTCGAPWRPSPGEGEAAHPVVWPSAAGTPTYSGQTCTRPCPLHDHMVAHPRAFHHHLAGQNLPHTALVSLQRGRMGTSQTTGELHRRFPRPATTRRRTSWRTTMVPGTGAR